MQSTEKPQICQRILRDGTMLGQSEASHQYALEERAAQLLLVFVAQTRYLGPIFYAVRLHGSFDVGARLGIL